MKFEVVRGSGKIGFRIMWVWIGVLVLFFVFCGILEIIFFFISYFLFV